MFGADPETFIMDLYNGENIPAYLFFSGTGKGNCFPLSDKYGGVHADNIMLEFNPTPSDSFAEVATNVFRCRELVHTLMMTKFGANEIILATKTKRDAFYPEARSSIQLLSNRAAYYQDRVEFYEIGCKPDYNAYTRDTNPMPQLPDNVRVAGGHIMISALDERLKDPEIVCNAVKWMDVLVMPTIIEGLKTMGYYDTTSSAMRRLYYGKAGCFRPKEFPNGMYGIEYRTPGPEWITLIESNQGKKYLDMVQTALIRSVENALEFKTPKVSRALIEEAVTKENPQALVDLQEIANYV